MPNAIARSIQEIGFAVLETQKGKPVFPNDAKHMIIIAGDADINQQASFTDSEDKKNSLDLLHRFQDQMGAGSWSVPMYVRPSGAPGTEPMGGAFYESLMGKKVVEDGVSVTYAQALTKPSFTVWIRKGHTVFFGAGACAESGKLNLVNKGGAKIDFSGGFMMRGWAGVGSAREAVADNTTVPVEDATKFTPEARVQIEDDDNSGAGYRIEAVDVEAKTITLADNVTCDAGAEIKGFLPDYDEPTEPLENRSMGITFDGSPKVLKSYDLNIDSPVAWMDMEITQSGNVEDYVESRRNIKGTISALFRQDDLKAFYQARQNKKMNVVATIGNGAGKTCTINLPYTQLESPQISNDAEVVSLTQEATSLGSQGEDSCTIVFS